MTTLVTNTHTITKTSTLISATHSCQYNKVTMTMLITTTYNKQTTNTKIPLQVIASNKVTMTTLIINISTITNTLPLISATHSYH